MVSLMAEFEQRVAGRVKTLTEERGITTRQIADATDLHPESVRRRHRGEQIWTLGELEIVAGLLDRDPSDFTVVTTDAR